jgi:hypothetical protein
MKTGKIIRNLIISGFIGTFIHSCNDDFLTKNKEGTYIFPPIYLHPDVGAESYPIVWKDAGNAAFKIVKKPDWLQVESMTGQFQNGIAKLTCYVVRNEFFTKEFVYTATIPIDVDGVGRCFVNVGYVNRGVPIYTGEPSFSCIWYASWSQESELMDFRRDEAERYINIGNQGSGYLIWEVIEYPEWISMVRGDDWNGTDLMAAVLPNGVSTIITSCNCSGLSDGVHVGYIVFKTNDKDQPTYTITVQCQVGYI